MPRRGKPLTHLVHDPQFGLALRISCARGDDDFFSSDLPDEKLAEIFGGINKPALFLPCEKDELVPPSVDRAGLLSRWTGFCPPGLAVEESGFVPGADHVVSGSESWVWISDAVVKFLGNL